MRAPASGRWERQGEPQDFWNGPWSEGVTGPWARTLHGKQDRESIWGTKPIRICMDWIWEEKRVAPRITQRFWSDHQKKGTGRKPSWSVWDISVRRLLVIRAGIVGRHLAARVEFREESGVEMKSWESQA